MLVSVVFERLWEVKKSRCKLIGNRLVLPHDTILSKSSFRSIPESNHLMQIDKPVEVIKEVEEFF